MQFAKFILLGLILSIITFPNLDWTFSTGIDPSLVWVFNHLGSTSISNGHTIIFPHGPLAFFMYPLPENIILVMLTVAVLKTLLLYGLHETVNWDKENNTILFPFIVAYVISIIAPFNHLLLSSLLLMLVCFYSSDNHIYKYVALVLVVFAFFVKSYVGILSLVMFGAFLVYLLIKERSLKNFFIDLGILFITLFVFRAIMFGTFHGFFNYFVGLFNLAQDNSSAASYYPANNWWVLTIFIITTIAIPFTNKDKKSIFFGLIAGLSLFAAWKHGMAREDIYHVTGLLVYLIIVLIIFNVFVTKNRLKNIILSCIAIALLAYNNTNALNYREVSYSLLKANNFIEFVTDYKNVLINLESQSANNIKGNKLPDEILTIVGESEVDIYPWDYSIIPANNLKWKPRVVIQSYASYTSWLDRQNAEYFNSIDAPNFLIWHGVAKEHSFNGGQFNSIDSRYILNDEPYTMLELISNYETVQANNKFVLLQKRKNQVEYSKTESEKETFTWGQWIEVPECENVLQRAKLDFDKSFKQSAKSFFYKDEQFWVLMQFDNGEVRANASN